MAIERARLKAYSHRVATKKKKNATASEIPASGLLPSGRYSRAKNPGRPGKVFALERMSAEDRQKMLALIRAGNLADTAAAAVGLTRLTCNDWLLRGNRLRQSMLDPFDRAKIKLTQKDWYLIRFAEDVEKAMGVAEANDVLALGKHVEGDWKAAAWRLERRNRAGWAPVARSVVGVVGAGAGAAPAGATTIAEAVAQMMTALEEKQGGAPEPYNDKHLDEEDDK